MINPPSDITFDSYFECGNLELVHQKSSNEFDLILKNDTNTVRHTHWFMFKVFKVSPGTVKFNILNYMKRKSLLSKGMSPVVSTVKCGGSEVKNLKYFKTLEESKKYFTVSFEFEFIQDNDWATFSLTRPYSFSKMLEMFKDIEQVEDEIAPKKIMTGKVMYKRETLCYSVAGNPIYLLTITGRDGKKGKKSAIVTARVHPGETVASYVIEGFIRFLMGNSDQADALRKMFVFKIIPMLNPDGVICGNSRTSLTGADLNRTWISPDKTEHPCIFYTKQFIKSFTQKHETLIYLDLHGHSKKLGTFIYGCNKVVNGSFTSWTKVRLYPRIVAKNTILFSYNDCIFNIQPKKEGTGRVVVWREIGISNSFTIESSIYGYHNGIEVAPYTMENCSEVGEEICKSLLEYMILLKSLEKELQLTNGWLKPSKFKEVSGTPAILVHRKKLEMEKREQKILEAREKTKNTRPGSRQLRLKVKESSENPLVPLFPDWKCYFTQEEVRIAQEKIRLGLESPYVSSSSESSGSEDNPVSTKKKKSLREFSPIIEDVSFWVSHPKPMKAVKKEADPSKCKFIKQHTSDFSGCYLDNLIMKNISSDTFRDHQRNMFFSRAERSRINKERIAKTRSMSNKRESRNLGEIGEGKGVNEKVFKIRPKVQKNYFFTKKKQAFITPTLCVSSMLEPITTLNKNFNF